MASTSSKTIGTTTLASTGGATASIFVAQFVVDAFQLQLTDGGQMGLAVLLAIIGGLIAGYLAPSKSEEVRKTLEEANLPTSESIADEVHKRAEIAVVKTEPTATTAETAPASVAVGGTGTASVADNPDSYPDLNAIAKA